MPKPENVIGKGFEKHPERINREGRPLKIYTIIKRAGYTKDDLRNAFGEAAWMNLETLKAIHEDETKPIILRIIANQFFLALKKGDWQKIKEILEHSIGKPQQNIGITATLPPIQYIDKLDEPK